MPTVDPEIRAGHETTGVTNEKDRGAAILLGRAELAEHVLRRPVPFPLGVLLEQRLNHRRHDVARGDGIDANTMRTPLRRQVATELDDTGFGRVVCGTDEALLSHTESAMRVHKPATS